MTSAPSGERSSAGLTRGLWATVVGTSALTVLVLPFGRIQLGEAPSFLPSLLAVVACLDVLSVALLAGEFRDEGDPRVLAMSVAYVWSLVTMLGYALAFPHVVAAHPPLAVTPSMAPWLYVAWHGGFPVLLAMAWLPTPAAWSAPIAHARRRRLARRWVLASAVASAAVVSCIVAGAHHLPVLIHGVDTTAMTRLTAPVTVPLALAGIVVAYLGTRRRTGPERWAPVVVLVCTADLVLTYAARHRFSFGWYAGRTLTLVAAGLVLLATIAALRRAKSRALHDSLVDGLTDLANRRSGHHDLAVLTEVARRSGAPLAIITFDLDHFKLINDQHGHDVGDEVLAGLGRALPTWLRASDIAARVGGEEFLLVLPNTTGPAAMVLAEKVRSRVGDITPARVDARVTISLGIAELAGSHDTVPDLLRRADEALYEAKRGGRDRVVAAVSQIPDQRRLPAPAHRPV